MGRNAAKENLILIAAVTPTFLERGALWFAENEDKIRRAIKTQPWWQDHVLFIEAGAPKKISEILRKLGELGYQKTQRIISPGEFSQLGDTIRVSPINREGVIRIEFRGNTIEEIAAEPLAALDKKPKPPKRELVFREGEYVVHIDHGIGIYRGLATRGQALNPKSEILNKSEIQNPNTKTGLEVGTSDLEFHVIEYATPRAGAAPDRLLVPRPQTKRLSLYIGFEHPTIHRLGGQLWPATKRKIKESAEAFARELLEIYAKREGRERPPMLGDPVMEYMFADAFAFIETPAQTQAIEEISKDLEKPTPMDRVLAGDVGFGKTEIAMRAAWRAVLSGKQVAMLAPTTILVEQHRQTFAERFKNFPIRISSLSRLTPPGDERQTRKDLADGEIDIIIGTHRLLSKDIKIPKLGLLIIDEEQRFGVRHKEHFKKLRSELDILSLSATPIPRTLSFTMAKLRGISQVNDPPPERIAIKNFILPYSDEISASAIRAELKRGGQAYVLHNRVETISEAARKLQELIPEAKIGIIHGRMDEKTLLRELTRFREEATNVLVATTIIENGIDLANVNTLIVENATRLGLSQAYQIRGRIGRGERQAFAYFLYPAKHLTDLARERLETLEAFEALGSGYEIALRDLEMRGAGSILGRDQSGAVQKGGLNLYCQLLSDALETLRAA
ncbi:MAG: Transcription-repair coupling factor [Parcubacteria group bacterium GW2011_GWB1_52_7]|nr:MAG: Transcription-repair coupling factor [Parcubacteria group bacterium GW2011_GWA1_51_12]KKW28549.1 MAG: Transcription-repair coupling factor [Parcubacteria group bacterium GW2011_GWB1_52_7]KKW31460.1 MAG: Transcription-repair coupling factor [Parcubacteria group bacterium GW2011_GWC2_52_8c]